jgi:2-polyprenyl-3-methyl-5-hydroxy-6-metoxy-1,4-benzoquinol methylase
MWFAEPLNHQLKPRDDGRETRYTWAKQHIAPGSFVLDVGCNCGQLAMNLSAELGCRGTGVDIVQEFVDYCRRQNIPGWTFRCADVTRLTKVTDARLLPARHFDVVTALEVIEHPINVRGFIRAVREALLPGGKLIVTTPHPDNPIFGYGGRFFSLPWHVRMWTPLRLEMAFGMPIATKVLLDPDGSPGHLAAVWRNVSPHSGICDRTGREVP